MSAETDEAVDLLIGAVQGAKAKLAVRCLQKRIHDLEWTVARIQAGPRVPAPQRSAQEQYEAGLYKARWGTRGGE